MDTTFNLRRWRQLVSLHWTENGRRYLLFIPVIAGLMALWFGMDLFSDPANAMTLQTQDNVYFIGLILAGGLHAYTLFNPFNNRRTATQYLTLPVSSLEHLLCNLFYGVFVFLLLYTFLFYLVDIPMVALARKAAEKTNVMILANGEYLFQHKKVLNIFINEPSHSYEPEQIPIMLEIQAAIMLGTLSFRKYSLLKSIVFILVVLFSFMIFSTKLVWADPSMHYRQFLTWDFQHYVVIRKDYMNSETMVLTPSYWLYLVVKTLFLSLAPVLWFITGVRLQQKEA